MHLDSTHITKSLRGIRSAWHFHCALVFLIKVVCSSFGMASLTP
ncbi:DUF3265 domain-containing protein [Vibrio campbellii]|uniref:DUF3265 domain-containing protein n=1 Tax=Vibrio campbellii TaxID=680 RepID=A0ABY5IKI8_9VIBR|nr:DUF3265 domain-containing protein [Vibrio campbellii]UTZ33346.1 DUF3265 domain-containing protein [Vibrio campbellii]